MVKFSTQVGGQRYNRTERLRINQTNADNSRQQQLYSEAEQIRQQKLSNPNLTLEEYESIYAGLRPELKPYFVSPNEIRTQRTNERQTQIERLSKLKAEAEQKANEYNQKAQQSSGETAKSYDEKKAYYEYLSAGYSEAISYSGRGYYNTNDLISYAEDYATYRERKPVYERVAKEEMGKQGYTPVYWNNNPNAPLVGFQKTSTQVINNAVNSNNGFTRIPQNTKTNPFNFIFENPVAFDKFGQPYTPLPKEKPSSTIMPVKGKEKTYQSITSSNIYQSIMKATEIPRTGVANFGEVLTSHLNPVFEPIINFGRREKDKNLFTGKAYRGLVMGAKVGALSYFPVTRIPTNIYFQANIAKDVATDPAGFVFDTFEYATTEPFELGGGLIGGRTGKTAYSRSVMKAKVRSGIADPNIKVTATTVSPTVRNKIYKQIAEIEARESSGLVNVNYEKVTQSRMYAVKVKDVKTDNLNTYIFAERSRATGDLNEYQGRRILQGYELSKDNKIVNKINAITEEIIQDDKSYLKTRAVIVKKNKLGLKQKYGMEILEEINNVAVEQGGSYNAKVSVVQGNLKASLNYPMQYSRTRAKGKGVVTEFKKIKDADKYLWSDTVNRIEIEKALRQDGSINEYNTMSVNKIKNIKYNLDVASIDIRGIEDGIIRGRTKNQVIKNPVNKAMKSFNDNNKPVKWKKQQKPKVLGDGTVSTNTLQGSIFEKPLSSRQIMNLIETELISRENIKLGGTPSILAKSLKDINSPNKNLFLPQVFKVSDGNIKESYSRITKFKQPLISKNVQTQVERQINKQVQNTRQRINQREILRERQTPSIKQSEQTIQRITQVLRQQQRPMLKQKIKVNLKPPVPRIPRIPQIKVPSIFPEKEKEKKKRGRPPKKRQIEELALSPDFTSKVLDINPKKIRKDQLVSEIKKVYTGLEIRRGVALVR